MKVLFLCRDKSGRRVLPNPPPFFRGSSPIDNKAFMIWFVSIDLKKIYEEGQGFCWPRPSGCPRCKSWKVWGHGYVQRCFDGFAKVLLLKCYRCPDCGCVITLRPKSHFARIHSSKETVRFQIFHRLKTGWWPPSALPRSRLRHWICNLKRRAHAFLTAIWDQGLRAGYEALISAGQTPIARLR